MYPKFIEVHGDVTDQALSANVEHIVMFSDGVIVLSNEPMSKEGKAFHVTETYDELKTLIKDCGCLIHKGDPRLDMKHPLMMDALRAMVGEPAWNSNTREWGLVVKDPEWKGEIQAGYYLRYADGTITRFDEEDLKKFPLYRMKQ